jgi:DNA mismatch repair protein MutH
VLGARARVRRKLSCVLWFPIQAGPRRLADRHLGTPRLWRPTPEQEALLRADWETLMGRIATGGIDEIDARQGQVLQVRPKAQNSRARAAGLGPEGEALAVVPRGFYLRARFTEHILWS